MTNQPWAPLESGAAPTARPAAVRGDSPRRLRLRRSRSPVLAALDGGGDVFQRRGRDVLVGAAVLIAPMVVVNLWLTVLAFDRFEDAGPSLPGLCDEANTGIEEVVALLALVLAGLTAAIVGFFAATILIADRFGATVGLRAALWATARRSPILLLAWAASHWWLPLADAWILGARDDQLLGRLLLTVPAVALLSSAVLYVVPVLVAERTGPLRAIRRGWALSRKRFGSSLGFVISSFAIGGLLLVGIAFLPALLEGSGLITFGDYTWLANGIAAQLAVIVVVPLLALATAQMYLEVRLDAEGMDLTLDAEAAFGPRPAT